MGRRHDEERTRENRTRQYPGGYDRHGNDERGYDRSGYQDRDLFGPYHDSRGNLFYEDREGYKHYEERPPDPYERKGYEQDQRQNTGRTAIKWSAIVAVALILVVGMVMATSNLTGGPSDSAQQAPQEQVPQQAPQQPVQPQQPQAPAQPQTPQQDGASAEQVEGMRADIERQLAEIRQSINQLRLEIWSFFTSQSNQQQEEPAQ